MLCIVRLLSSVAPLIPSQDKAFDTLQAKLVMCSCYQGSAVTLHVRIHMCGNKETCSILVNNEYYQSIAATCKCCKAIHVCWYVAWYISFTCKGEQTCMSVGGGGLIVLCVCARTRHTWHCERHCSWGMLVARTWACRGFCERAWQAHSRCHSTPRSCGAAH